MWDFKLLLKLFLCVLLKIACLEVSHQLNYRFEPDLKWPVGHMLERLLRPPGCTKGGLRFRISKINGHGRDLTCNTLTCN